MVETTRVKVTCGNGYEWVRDYIGVTPTRALAFVHNDGWLVFSRNGGAVSVVAGSPEEVERMTATSSLGPEPESVSGALEFVLTPGHKGPRIRSRK